jgi:tol-pal system protein YbgF
MKRLALLCAALLAGACASSGDVERLQERVSELQDELAGIKRTTAGKEEVQNVNQRIAEQTEMLLKSNATLVAKVEQMEQRIENAQGSIEQTNYRIDRLVQQLTQQQHDLEAIKAQLASGAPTPPSVPVPPSSTAPPTPLPAPAQTEILVPAPQPPSSESPLQLYNSAYRDYQKANFDLAIQGFRDFLEQNPNSDLADNAAYWIGESLFAQKKYQDAIAQFDAVVTRYSRSDKVPGALLKKGYAYISLGERAQGIVQLQYVVHEHPNSSEAQLARQRLRQLGVETR